MKSRKLRKARYNIQFNSPGDSPLCHQKSPTSIIFNYKGLTTSQRIIFPKTGRSVTMAVCIFFVLLLLPPSPAFTSFRDRLRVYPLGLVHEQATPRKSTYTLRRIQIYLNFLSALFSINQRSGTTPRA
jgi:hypothetical protein